jgi:hypothetical protein
MIYICIPVYNEERTIGVVLWKIRQVMSEFGRDYQVLVVDDGSTDGTDDVMTPYARIMPVHVRRHDRREGYAPSLEALVREADARSAYPKRDVVVTLQADFTDEPEDVAQLVKRVEGGADLVTARIRPVAEGMPREHALVAVASGTCCCGGSAVGAEDGDVLSGFRAYRVMRFARPSRRATAAHHARTAGPPTPSCSARWRPTPDATEAVDVHVRYGRLQRESRFRPVRTSVELARLLRRRTSAPQPPPPAEAASGTGLGSETGGGSTGTPRGPRSRDAANTPS